MDEKKIEELKIDVLTLMDRYNLVFNSQVADAFLQTTLGSVVKICEYDVIGAYLCIERAKQTIRSYAEMVLVNTDEISRGSRIIIKTKDSEYYCIVDNALNLGSASDPNWYIECHDPDGTQRYWKQKIDGGSLRLVG